MMRIRMRVNSRTAAAATAAVIVSSVSVIAQSTPLSCIAELRREYGSFAPLNPHCPNEKQCIFEAPLANASVRVLVGVIVKRAGVCFKAAGLTSKTENTIPSGGVSGSVWLYDGADGKLKCKIVIVKGQIDIPDAPQGVGVACE